MGRRRRPKQGTKARIGQKERIGKKMLSLSFVILPSLAAASILPIKFDFGDSAKSRPSLRSVQQCEGHENDDLVLISGTTPDEICMPGNTVINMHTSIREDLPTDLTLNLDLHKITPFPMTVPCLNGVGSCEYELCPMIEDMADTVCPSFPENQPCGCPLLMGDAPGGNRDASARHGADSWRGDEGIVQGHCDALWSLKQGQNSWLH